MLTFQATDLQDVVLVETGVHRDERGGFARLYCPEAFAAAGISFAANQINLSTNTLRHTLRGLHFQAAPRAEAKFVRVVTGAVYDVVLDLRPDSPSYRRWQAFELTADNLRGLFIPEGCAHGFLTLEDDTGVLYQMGRPYEPGHAAGIRYDDPAFAIDWPAAPVSISRADRDWPLFEG